MSRAAAPSSVDRVIGIVSLASTLLFGCILASAGEAIAESPKGAVVQAFQISDLIEQRSASKEPWLEFLRVPDLSMGLYVLAAGEEDLQGPHTEDEVYYVLSGKGVLRVDTKDQAVEAGSLVFVAKNTNHRFHSITSELRVIVFFAPAEGAKQQPESD